MATIALRVPTVIPHQTYLPNGHCYIVLAEPTITVRELIAEKVRAELRKARAGGWHTSSLSLLLPQGKEVGHGPLDEQLAIAQACRGFTLGDYLLLHNDRPLVDLDEMLHIERRTSVTFVCHKTTPVAERQLQEAA